MQDIVKSPPVPIFLAYAFEDSSFQEELTTHLSVMIEEGKIELWSLDNLVPGTTISEGVEAEMDKAQLFLFLISADFNASKECHLIEDKAFAHQKAKEIPIVPILTRPCLLDSRYLNYQILPEGKKAITHKSWSNRDEAYTKVVEEIETLVEKIANHEAIPVPKPPGLFRRLFYQYSWLFLTIFYFLLTTLAVQYLMQPARNIPATFDLKVSQMSFEFVRALEGDFLANLPIADEVRIAFFNRVTFPVSRIKFSEESAEDLPLLTETRISFLPISKQEDPKITLFKVRLDEWELPEKAQLNLSKLPDRPLSVKLEEGSSTGELSFQDSVELYTESCKLVTGEQEWKVDLDFTAFHSIGKILYESQAKHFELLFDFGDESILEGDFEIDKPQFFRHVLGEKHVYFSTILSGEITVGGFETTKLNELDNSILNIENKTPIRVNQLTIEEDGIKLKMESDIIGDLSLQKESDKTQAKQSIMPSRLAWFWHNRKIEVILYAVATILLLGFFTFRAIRKR